MRAFRTVFQDENLPIVIGSISDSKADEKKKTWKYGAIVQKAQAEFAMEDEHAALVKSTSGYTYSDKYHYGTKGYMALGKEFARAVYQLQKNRQE
jgi:hypothetical protein